MWREFIITLIIFFLRKLTFKASGLSRRSRDFPMQYMNLAVQPLGISLQLGYLGQLLLRELAQDQKSNAAPNGENFIASFLRPPWPFLAY